MYDCLRDKQVGDALLENDKMKTPSVHMNSDNYSIVRHEERFIVVDRNMEKVYEKSFSNAALAIGWAEDRYMSLI